MKNVIIITLAILLVFAVLPASAAHDYYDNKIVEFNPIASYNALPQQQHGILNVQLTCHSNSLTREFILQLVDESKPLPAYTNGAKVQKEFYDLFPLTGSPATFEFDNVGHATLPIPTTGTYAVLVHNGYSTWDEFAIVHVTQGYESTATLYGQYATGDDKPKDASINAFFGCRDVDVQWIKIVKTGEHVVPAWDNEVCKMVKVIDTPAVIGKPAVTHQITVIDTPAVPAWDEVIIDHPAVPATPDTYQIVTGGSFTGYCKEVGSSSPHDFEIGSKKYQIVGSTHDLKYKKTAGTPAIPAVTHTVHHAAIPAVTHQETVIDVPAVIAQPEVSHMERQCHIEHHNAYTVNEYGLEIFLEIDGAEVSVDNPNARNVNVNYQFDVNYFVDTRPWDFIATPGQIKPRVKTYSGTLTNVGRGASTIHTIITPDIDDAVQVVDAYDGILYTPFISNDIVTRTIWS